MADYEPRMLLKTVSFAGELPPGAGTRGRIVVAVIAVPLACH